MTRSRSRPYVWVNWLSKLMTGEVRCHWAPWFRTHYMDYTNAPSNFQSAVWATDHTKLLDELANERRAHGEGILKESQSRFRIRRPSGLTIAGKPDLIALDNEGHATIYEAKTEHPRQSDIIQVMLYMMSLPYGSPLFRNKTLLGCIVYKSGARSYIPPNAIDNAFQNNVTYFLNTLECRNPPAKTPNPIECGVCDITQEDCPERLESDESTTKEQTEPIIPI